MIASQVLFAQVYAPILDVDIVSRQPLAIVEKKRTYELGVGVDE
jgi:hypothetical protein